MAGDGDPPPPAAGRVARAPKSPIDDDGTAPRLPYIRKLPPFRADAEAAGARGAPRRSPWLSAPLILGNEVASNVA